MNLPNYNFKWKDDAGTIVDDLRKEIDQYNKQLGEENVVGMALTSFGKEITIYVLAIGVRGDRLIGITGLIPNEDKPVELIQHPSQLNFLLKPLPRKNKEEPKKPIGYLQ
jgi:hypothetical protein